MSAPSGPDGQPAPAQPRPLGTLLERLTTTLRPGHSADTAITAITARSEDVRPGTLFVAIPGSSADGHAFVADAARRGAAAILVERDVGGALDAPLVRVDNVRRALAELAAAWHGDPARRLTMVGITGTAGKTSTLSLLEAMLLEGGKRVGTIGSLGLHIQGETASETVYTTPDPMLLHQELARIADAGSDILAMEVTSHALVQERVHGLRYDLGMFTNLLPLEHSEYHDDFEDYIRAKSLFFDLLQPDAPLLFNIDDPATRALVESRTLRRVGIGGDPTAAVRITASGVSATGTRLQLDVPRPLPSPGGGTVAPAGLDVRLRLLGDSNIANASLAAAAALSLGVEPDQVAAALAAFEPPPRRMEVVHDGPFMVLDDTVGHPESMNAIFRVVDALGPERLHIVCAVRGQRGVRINRENAETLTIWAERLPVATLVVTRGEEAADDLNRVEPEEYDAFMDPLRSRGLDVREIGRLEPAVEAALDRARPGDLVALLGAQGMNEGQAIVRSWLADREAGARDRG